MNTNAHKFSAIVLAAGSSGRMGTFKPLLPFGDKPMIARVIESIVEAGMIRPIYLITGHNPGAMLSAVGHYAVTPLWNENYKTGEMISSIRVGVERLDKDVAAFLIVLGDQPAVDPTTIRLLIYAWNKTSPLLAIPTFGGKRGHPLLVSTALIPEILALSPTATLRDVVHRHLAGAVEVAVEDEAVVIDVGKIACMTGAAYGVTLMLLRMEVGRAGKRT